MRITIPEERHAIEVVLYPFPLFIGFFLPLFFCFLFGGGILPCLVSIGSDNPSHLHKVIGSRIQRHECLGVNAVIGCDNVVAQSEFDAFLFALYVCRNAEIGNASAYAEAFESRFPEGVNGFPGCLILELGHFLFGHSVAP
ncbi:MAG: hypothetical protein ACI3Z7_01460 [Candidatus Aphodosoma sp.]